MSIVKLDGRLKSQLTVTANHPIKIISHSNAPYTGTVSLFDERSSVVKGFSSQTTGYFADDSLQSNMRETNESFRVALAEGSAEDYSGRMLELLDEGLKNTIQSEANTRSMKAFRFETPFVYDVNYAAYKTVKGLYRYHRKNHESMDFSFRNYNTLNF